MRANEEFIMLADSLDSNDINTAWHNIYLVEFLITLFPFVLLAYLIFGKLVTGVKFNLKQSVVLIYRVWFEKYWSSK